MNVLITFTAQYDKPAQTSLDPLMLRHCAILVFAPVLVITSDDYPTVHCLEERFGGEWKSAIVKQMGRFYKKRSLKGLVRATYDCDLENFDPQKPYLEFNYWIGIDAGEFGKQTARELRRQQAQITVRNSTVFIGCMFGATKDTATNFKIYCNYKLVRRSK